jgi:serine/threonine protein phosphatase PrpC
VMLDREDDVYRIMDLSVSRAFGDVRYSKYVTHKPDIFTRTVKKSDQFMIIACDGLWDVMSSQDASNYVIKNGHKDNVSRSLAKHAIKKLGSTDNVSVMVVYFVQPKSKTKPKPQKKK